jgi:TolA-binding protein
MEFFEEKNYSSARQEFERVGKQRKSTEENQINFLLETAAFYIAIAAAENNDEDAEKLLKNFSADYPSSQKVNHIAYYLGRYFYMQNKYQDCIDALSKLTVFDVPQQYKYDYQFQLGYSYFIKKKFDEAKPLFKAIKTIKEKYYYPSNYYYAFISFSKKDYDEALKSFKLVEDSKTFASVTPFYVAQIYYQKKDYKKTISYINDNIDGIEPQYKDEMQHLLGESYFQLNEFEKAIPLLEKKVNNSNKVRKEDLYELGFAQYKVGSYRKAVENLLQLNLLNDKMGQNATYTLADCYLKLGEKENAKSAFQSAASKDFDLDIKKQSLLNFAKLTLELGSPNEAVQALEIYLKDNTNKTIYDEANDLMALALLQTKDYERAYNLIEKFNPLSSTLKETYQRITYYRAIQVYNDNKLDDAKLLTEKSLKYPIRKEIQAGANYLLGEINFSKKQYKEAIANYTNYTQLTDKNIDNTLGYSEDLATYNIGYAYFKTKQYVQAQSFFKKFVSSNFSKENIILDAQLRLAEVAFINKDYTTSYQNYDKVSKSISCESEYGHFQKSIVTGLKGNTSDKITELKNIINIYPNSKTLDRTYFEIGETYLNDDNQNEAINFYKQLLSNFPNSNLRPNTHLKIALAEYNRENKEEAAKTYNYVIKEYPNSPEAKQAALSLKQLGVEMGRPDLYENLNNISASEKDSLTFYAAETAYSNGDCTKAIDLLSNYIKQFKNGFFIDKAYNYRAECRVKNKLYQDVLVDYDYIIEKTPSLREKTFLNASGVAFFELKDYEKAMKYYSKLFEVSSNAQNIYIALIGEHKCAVMLKDDAKIISTADKIIVSKSAKEIDIMNAHFVKGNALYRKNDLGLAYESFDKVANGVSSEKAAESKYMTAKILNQNTNYKSSLDTCFKIKSKFASYEYWYVKSFILMADNYSKLGNTLQAKATLESITANYKGDEGLVNEAKNLLEIISKEEFERSNLKITNPEDDLETIIPTEENK